MPRATRKKGSQQVTAGIRAAKEAATTQGKRVVKSAKAASKQVDAYARKQPWHVAAIAAGVGLVAGILISGKGKSKRK